MAFRRSNVTATLTLILLLNTIFIVCVLSQNTNSCPPTLTPNRCPKDTLKFGVCGSWLGLVTEVIGTKPSPECCTLIKGIADLEAAVCLCTAIKANVLGVIKLKVPVALSLLLNACGKKIPEGFKC